VRVADEAERPDHSNVNTKISATWTPGSVMVKGRIGIVDTRIGIVDT
jgi:hypothetical protein